MRTRNRNATICSLLLLGIFLPAAVVHSQQGPRSGTSRKEAPKVPPPVRAPRPETRTLPDPTPPLIFVTGTVIKEDGEPAPFETMIKMDCGSSSATETTIALNGTFSFQVGGRDGSRYMHPDAAERIEQYPYSGISAAPTDLQAATMTRKMLGCELSAQLNGYRSTVLRLDRDLTAGQNEFGTIVIYPIEKVRGTSISLTSLAAPKAARKKMEQAQKAFGKKKFAEAEALLQSAVQLYPGYAEAWFTLGQVHWRNNRNAEARDSFRKASDLDKNYVNPHVGLAHIAALENRWSEAAEFSERSLELDPVGFIDAYYTNALANYWLNNLDLAEKRVKQGLRMDTPNRFPQLHLLMAAILSTKQDLDGSIRELKIYLTVAPDAPNAGLIKSRVQKMEELSAAGDSKKTR
jgi:tetratricopeptide (TPR) repeat protein